MLNIFKRTLLRHSIFTSSKPEFHENKALVDANINIPNFISKKYFTATDYDLLLGLLFHGENIEPLCQLENINPNRNVLRHDVDHDIQTALNIGEWEEKRGIRATYCLLHTAWYYGEIMNGKYNHSLMLKDAAKRLTEQGHEINFHNNLITIAYENGLEARDLLKYEIDFFDSLGIGIKGTSTHGDALCHRYGYRNFHIFSEIADVSPPKLSIDCPDSIRRAIGSVSMKELGLSYEAYGFSSERYVSDSGGKLISHLSMPGWASTCLPELENQGRKVGVYLMTHPVWWKF